jgi:hypothetical protein
VFSSGRLQGSQAQETSGIPSPVRDTAAISRCIFRDPVPPRDGG